MIILTKMVHECILFLHPSRKHSKMYNKQRHYIDFVPVEHRNSTLDEQISKMLKAFTSSM